MHATVPRTRVRALSPRLVLGGIVAASTVVLELLTRQVVTPSVFPDEYLYSQLGRGIATTGHATVRGVNPHFLPLFQPLVTAPMWLVPDVGTAFRLVQLENALVWSLAAVPAYLLARELGIRTNLSLGIAALAVVGPQALFVGMVMAEPYGYTLSLLVVLLTVRMLARPSRRGQAVLLAVSGLAAFDRLQLAALPLCACIAVVGSGLRERRLRAAVREQWLLLGALAVVLLGGVGWTLLHGLGYYHLHPKTQGAWHMLTFAGLDGYIVLLAAGAAVAPSALVGLAQSLARPRSRAELAFGTLAVSLTVVIVVQCVLWGDTHRIQERYLGYLVPLAAIAFGLRRSRVGRRPVAEIGVAAGMAVVAALVPLSSYAIDAQHVLVPTLYAFTRIQKLNGSPTETAAIFALATTLLAAAGCIPRARLVLVLSTAASFALLAFAFSWSGLLSKDGRANYLPADVRWVDHAVRGKASMLVVGNAWNGQALATLIWNPSVARVVRMPGANKVDWLDDPYVHVRADGVVTLDGAPLTGDVLVDVSPSSAVTLRGRAVRSFGAATLWRPSGAAQLTAIMNNRLPDGRVLKSGGMEVWSPTGVLDGWIELRVHAPRTLGGAHVDLVRTGVDVPAGATRVVRVASCGRGPWTGGFVASPVTVRDGHWRSPLVSTPRYVADPSACS